MVKKSFHVVKNNPILILFYAAYLIVSILVMYLIYPDNLSQFPSNVNVATIDLVAYKNAMIRLLLASFLLYIMGVLFISGFGNMIKEAILQEKTSVSFFLPGIRKYFVRNLLSSLLMAAFIMGYAIILSILTIIIALSLGQTASLFIPIFTILLVLIAIPFVILWSPAIFIDDIGVIRGLSKGAKAGANNYWRLFLLIIVMNLPTVGNIIINYNSTPSVEIFNPSMIITYILSAAITIFVIPYLFMVYRDNNSNKLMEDGSQ